MAKPLLVGLAVDVSGSMASAIENPDGPTTNRLDAVRRAFRDMAERGRELAEDEHDSDSVVRLFAYGFGFNNALSLILGRVGPDVRDLFGEDHLVSAFELVEDWDRLERHLDRLGRDMLGSTPMLKALQVARHRFAVERRKREYDQAVLFLLSDGLPEHGTVEQVRAEADQLKNDGVLVVSCYVTDSDAMAPRRLPGSPGRHWQEGARLMFECASPMPADSGLTHYLTDQGWSTDPRAKLFTQANRSDVLAEFMSATVSPASSRPQAHEPVEVFISYAHRDEELRQGLERHLALLRRQGHISFWTDRDIVPGQSYNTEIDQAIESAEMILLLVSVEFLASDYCYGKELTRALERHSDGAAVVIPVLMRPVDWTGAPFDHLASLPTDARPITAWPTMDDGFTDAAKGIRRAVAKLRST